VRQSKDTAEEFQKRRATTWRLEKPWLAAALLAGLGAFLAVGVDVLSEPRKSGLFLLSFVVLIVAIVRINFILMRHYRCPGCDAMPIDRGGDGVQLDPVQCPKCGAVLK